jgi:hypothetical protein
LGHDDEPNPLLVDAKELLSSWTYELSLEDEATKAALPPLEVEPLPPELPAFRMEVRLSVLLKSNLSLVELLGSK